MMSGPDSRLSQIPKDAIEVRSRVGQIFYQLKEDIVVVDPAVGIVVDSVVYGPTGDRFIKHRVDRSESVMGLVCRYDCEEGLIRRYNRNVIFEALDNCHGDDIFIPVNQSFGQVT
jgi:hypothetical protein